MVGMDYMLHNVLIRGNKVLAMMHMFFEVQWGTRLECQTLPDHVAVAGHQTLALTSDIRHCHPAQPATGPTAPQLQ